MNDPEPVEVPCPVCYGQRSILHHAAGYPPGTYRLDPCATCLGTGSAWRTPPTPPLTPPARPPSPSD